MVKKLDYKITASLFFTLFYCVLILPIDETVAFYKPSTHKTLLLSYGLKLLFGLVLFCITYFTLHFVGKIRVKDKFYMSWLKFGLIHFLIIFTIFLLMYPGHWVANEFNVVDAVKHYGLYYNWQNFFTNIFYTLCMYLIPTAVSVVFIQITIASFIIGYIISQFQTFLRNPPLAYFLLIPFILFPVLVNDLYPLRTILYSYLQLLFIVELLLIFGRPNKVHRTSFELIKLSVLITLLSFWRSEGIYYLLLFPILVYTFHIFNHQTYRTLAPYLLTGLCLIFIFTGYAITKATSSSAYDVPSMVNPLSTMLQKPLKGTDINQRLAIMNKTVNIRLVQRYPSYNETPSFWDGALRPDYAVHMKSFEKEFIYLVLHNPNLYLENRYDTFKSTNSFDAVASTSIGPFDTVHYKQSTVSGPFMKNNLLSEPINERMHAAVTNFLSSLNTSGKFTFWAHIFWDSIIPMVLLLIVGIREIIKKQWLWVGIVFLVLVRVPLLFLTAPANYFFYYLPVYMSGYFLVILNLIFYLDKRHESPLRNILPRKLS